MQSKTMNFISPNFFAKYSLITVIMGAGSSIFRQTVVISFGMDFDIAGHFFNYSHDGSDET
ncbi:MAG: hypothetical protein R6W67_00070 [Bacteroidales bacterium]